METTAAEIKAYFGMLILMGIHNLPRENMYWSTDNRLGVEGIQIIMPKHRFKKISEYIHIVDNTKAMGTNDRLYKVRPLIDMGNRNFLECYKPKKNISIDEAMIPFKGRSSLRQYMPGKPVKWGMKVWCACESESGYLLQFSVYCGRRDNATQKGLGHDVIMTLATPFFGKYHHFFFDNFFSSVDLMTALLQEKTYAASTVRKNRKGLPVAFGKKRKLKQGEHEVFQKDEPIATVWHDKRDVLMLYTNTSHKLDKVQRWDRESRSKKDVPCPAAVKLYNECMGGVDRADQQRTYYSTIRKSRKYWKYLLSFVLDSAINNAFILYKSVVKPTQRYDQLQFRLDLSDQLIAGFSIRSRAGTKRKMPTVSQENMRAHNQVRMEGRKKACALCRKAKVRTPAGRSVETSYGCDVCKVHFCKDTCFSKHLVIE